MPANTMSDLTPANAGRMRPRQHGVVLFLTLIALLAMSLAAVALIRSVNTSALIAGNLAFQRAATSSADAGIQAAINKVNDIQGNAANVGHILTSDPANLLNKTDTATYPGYHSGIYLTGSFSSASWAAPDFVTLNPDDSGNTVTYIVERMCRSENAALKDADCLYAGTVTDTNYKSVGDESTGTPPPPGGQPAQMRVTIRTLGSTGAVSYVQGFIF